MFVLVMTESHLSCAATEYACSASRGPKRSLGNTRNAALGGFEQRATAPPRRRRWPLGHRGARRGRSSPPPAAKQSGQIVTSLAKPLIEAPIPPQGGRGGEAP